MNYKIAKTMLILCVVYLIGFYVLKFAFPDLLLQSITSPTMLQLGKFLSTHSWFDFIFRTITTFVPIYLFACASTGRFKFSWLEMAYIIIGTLVCRLVAIFAQQFYTHTSTAVMFLVAMLCKGKLTYATITFTIHGYLTMLLTSIRGFETIIFMLNTINGFMLALEAYMWEILLAIIFNIKEKKQNGLHSTVC